MGKRFAVAIVLLSVCSGCVETTSDVQSDPKPQRRVMTLDDKCLDLGHDCAVCLFTDKDRERDDCSDCGIYDSVCKKGRR